MRLSIRTFISLLMVIAIPSHAIASESALQIAKYLGMPERIRYQSEQAIPAIQRTDPQFANALQRSLKYMDSSEVVGRAADVIDHTMTVKDIETIIKFIDTPTGIKVGQIFQTVFDPEAMGRAINAFPPGEKSKANVFLNSASGRHLLDTMNSPEWHKTWNDYGEVLLCRFFEKENAPLFERLKSNGKCMPSST